MQFLEKVPVSRQFLKITERGFSLTIEMQTIEMVCFLLKIWYKFVID